MSTYRDDLEAAHARAAAAEGEAERLRREVDRLKQPTDDVPEVPIPERFKVVRTANELTVSWRWFRTQVLAMLFFVIAWDAFLLFWYFGPMAGQGGLLFQIFPVGHVAVGVGLTYYVLTGFANRTVISVQSGMLRVNHGPLPWRGNQRIARDELRQLYVAENEHRHKNNNSVTITKSYDLCAVLESGREVRLLRKLDAPLQAQYLERAFEAYLGIADRRVAGEIPKP